MRDQLDRQLRHPCLEPSLAGVPAVESAVGEIVGDPRADTAANHGRHRTVGKRQIARERAQREAEAIERGGGKHVIALERELP